VADDYSRCAGHGATDKANPRRLVVHLTLWVAVFFFLSVVSLFSCE
jgi:hypothetical protein